MLSRKLQENRLLQPTEDAMATGGEIIMGELMAAGEAEVQSVQTTLDGGIVASRDSRFVCWPSSLLGVIVALLLSVLLARASGP